MKIGIILFIVFGLMSLSTHHCEVIAEWCLLVAEGV